MAKLNQEERRYALKRVDEITRERDERLRKKHIIKPKQLTDAQKKRQIIRGEASLSHSGWTLSTPIGECYRFDEEGESLDMDAYRSAKSALRKEAAVVSDAIVLGEAEEAKRLLAAFEKTV